MEVNRTKGIMMYSAPECMVLALSETNILCENSKTGSLEKYNTSDFEW